MLIKYKGGNMTLQWRNLADLTKSSKLTLPVMKINQIIR